MDWQQNSHPGFTPTSTYDAEIECALYLFDYGHYSPQEQGAVGGGGVQVRADPPAEGDRALPAARGPPPLPRRLRDGAQRLPPDRPRGKRQRRFRLLVCFVVLPPRKVRPDHISFVRWTNTHRGLFD